MDEKPQGGREGGREMEKEMGTDTGTCLVATIAQAIFDPDTTGFALRLRPDGHSGGAAGRHAPLRVTDASDPLFCFCVLCLHAKRWDQMMNKNVFFHRRQQRITS